MKTLVFDSSGGGFSLGLAEGGRVLARHASRESGRVAEELLPAAGKLLNEAGWTLRSLDCVGLLTGPGSFTGLRIGIATAMGLAAATGLRLVGIGSFEALRETVRDACGNRPLLCLENARIGEFYAALYEAGKPDPVVAEAVYPESRIRELLSRGPALAGRAWRSRNGETFGRTDVEAEAASLDAIAALVEAQAAKREFAASPQQILPRYLGISPVT